MKKACILFSILFHILPATTFAITNIEKLQTDKDTPLTGEFAIAFDGKSGNNDKQTTSANLRVFYDEGIHRSLAIIEYEYGKNNGAISADSRFVHLRYSQDINDLHAWETYVQNEKEAFQKLDSRALIGGGLRSNLLNTKKTSVTTGIGTYYTREIYATTPEKQRNHYFRISTYMAINLQLHDRVKLNNILYFQPRVSDLDDIYALNDFAVTGDVTDHIAVRLTVQSRFDSEPVEDVKETDHHYKTSLVWRF